MEEKEKVDATSSLEDKELTQEEEEAAIHWKTKANRPAWAPEEGENKLYTPSEPTPEEEAELRQTLEEARRRADEVPEEEMHPEYKRMMGIGAAPTPEGEAEKEEAKVHYAKCGECGASVPYSDLHDNGSFLVCSKCY